MLHAHHSLLVLSTIHAYLFFSTLCTCFLALRCVMARLCFLRSTRISSFKCSVSVLLCSRCVMVSPCFLHSARISSFQCSVDFLKLQAHQGLLMFLGSVGISFFPCYAHVFLSFERTTVSPCFLLSMHISSFPHSACIFLCSVLVTVYHAFYNPAVFLLFTLRTCSCARRASWSAYVFYAPSVFLLLNAPRVLSCPPLPVSHDLHVLSTFSAYFFFSTLRTCFLALRAHHSPPVFCTL